MERLEMLESVRVSENGVNSFDDEAEQMDSSLKGSENWGVDILEDLDSYWKDINERLIISRMVSDSVIKGMVNAVEQEAAEKIASKELELANLKDSLHKSINYGQCSSSIEVCVENDNMRESLESLRNAAREEFKKLKQGINGVKGYNSIRKISSSSELVGLGGILKENENGSWVCVDKTLDRLESVVHDMCSTVGDVVRSSKKSIQEMEFQRQVEAMVIQSSIRSIQEEFEEKFWDRNASFCGNRSSVNWLEKFEEISSLRKELDVILKLFPNQETGQLISHGSYDLDHSNSPSLWESNGHNETKMGVPDKFDAAQFPHTSKQELVKVFNSTITQMKREHESIVQQKTEQYYHLKAKYLNERGSSLSLRKDKESDVLRKKIPEVIMKLDDILVENEKFPAFNNNVESLGSLKNRLDDLLSKNQQLRDLITEKKNEVKRLSLQVSDATEKVLEHNLAEANLVKLVENLELSKEDANIEASVREDVYKCVIKELSGRNERDNEESYRVLLGESGRKNERIGECDEIEDSDMESLIMQGVCEVIYGEAIKEAEEQVKELDKELLIANESLAKFEREALEKEKEFRLELEEKAKLREKLSGELKNVKEQLEFASEELHKLKDHTNLQEKLIGERSEEFNVAKAKLLEAVEQGEVYKMEIKGLNEELEVAMEELKKADEVRKMVLVLSREKENVLSRFEMQEKERAKQMEALVVLVNELAEKIVSFESKVKEDIEGNNSRLETSRYQLSYLIKKVNDLARTESLYKQRLHRRCTDLEMAEAEVDLLGDEVEALSSLLEKIYIALDHYSPILQHYPGIIDILKLVRRELSGEHTKSV